MATVSRLYEVVLAGHLAGQGIVNRWNYLGTGDDTVALPVMGLATALGAAEVGTQFAAGSLFQAILDWQHSDMVWEQCLLRSIYVPTDFLDLPFNPTKPGVITSGETEAPFAAVGFKSSRVRTDIGRGYKRFAGVGEGSVIGKGILDPTFLASLTALAGLLGTTLSHTFTSLTWNYVPVIVGRDKSVIVDGRKTYPYYPTETEQAAHLAQGMTWAAYGEIRSQVSRQYGKGN